MELNWLYRRFGDEFGPVSFETLQELRQTGQLDDDDLIRKTSENEWRMAATLPDAEPTTDLDLDVAKLLASAENASARQIRDQGVHLDKILSAGRRNFVPGTAAQQVAEEAVATWYYRSFNQVLGPFSFDVLKEMAENGSLDRGDDVREGEDGVWLSAKRLPELFPKKTDDRGSSAEIDTIESEKPDWVCRIDGKEQDPMTLSELKKLARLGELDRKDMVRRTWGAAWVHAQDIAGLQFPAPVSPPSAPSAPPTNLAKAEAEPEKRSSHSIEAVRPAAEYTPRSSGMASSAPSMPTSSPPRGYVPPSAATAPPPPSPAYRPSAPPPPSMPRSRSSGPSFNFALPSGLVDTFKNPKLYGALGACLLLGVLIVGGRFFIGTPGAKEFALVQEIWTEVDGAVKANAPDAAFKAISDKHLAAVKDLRKRIEPRASAQNRLAQIILYCTRDHLPKILAGNGEEERKKQYERMKADIQEASELYQRMNG